MQNNMLRNHFIKSRTIEQLNYTIYYTADSKVPFIGGEQTQNLTMWETGYESEPLATFKVLQDSFADGYGQWSIKTSNPSCFYCLIKDKNGYEYSIDSGNTNIITGLIFPDYDYNYNYITEIGGPLLGYGEGNNLTDITLPSNLQYIGDSTFKGSTYLQTITIPEYVTCLGNYAFQNCESLTLISLPQDVEVIGTDCFKGCTNLVDFYCNSSTPPSLNGCDIFGDYTDIPNLTINVLYLDKYLTNDDWKLYSTIIKQHPKTIGYKAQNEVRLDLRYWNDFSIQSHNYNSGYGVIISNNELVTRVPANAFQSISEITDVFLPESITHIGNAAFQKCTSLTNICLPKNTQVLGTACFSYTNLSEITLTKSVTQIGQGVFINTPLSKVVYEGTLEDWCKINFSNAQTQYDVASANPMYYGAEKVYIDGKILEGEIILPSILNRQCIVNNNLIHSVIIPENTSEVQAPIIRNCEALTKVQWNATDCQVTRESSVGVFSGCSNLTEFIFGDNVKSIPQYICRDCNISTVIIPDSVTSIGEEAFYNCSLLNTIVIGNNVTSIGNSAFRDCKFLTAVELPDSVTSIGNSAFRGCGYITSMVIPESVTSIGDSAFWGCGLRSIVIPNSITSINSYTFYGCAALTSITIPESVTSIGSYAFYDCRYLPSIVIPNSVTSIGSLVFSGCEALTSITFNGTIAQWNKIKLGYSWSSSVPATAIHCTDGDVTL